MTERFTSVTGAAATLLRANIDTDALAPARLEKEFGEKGGANLAAGLFANLRYDENGEEIPDFVLNRRPFREAKILLGGPNFGCGSSRESAVWTLKAFGISCVIAPSFGEIFYNNCFKNGALPVILERAEVEVLAAEAQPGAPDALFTVDLMSQSIAAPSGRRIEFSVPAFRRQGLLEGLDEIAVTLRRTVEIAAFLADARAKRPWAYPAPAE
jgi:3-isopropylmalate/(R)-2-methylmalate dehydratase small subunit